jgi:hypothetical protein
MTSRLLVEEEPDKMSHFETQIAEYLGWQAFFVITAQTP